MNAVEQIIALIVSIATIILANRLILNDRINGLEKTIDAKLDGLDGKLTEKIDGVEKSLIERINGVEGRLIERIDGVEKRLDQRINDSENHFNKRFDGLEKRFDKLDAKVDELSKVPR